MYVCLSVCPGYLQNYTCDLYQIFYSYCLWPWLGLPPAWDKIQGEGQFWEVFFPVGIVGFNVQLDTL